MVNLSAPCMAAIVSGGFYLVANNTSLASGWDWQLQRLLSMEWREAITMEREEGKGSTVALTFRSA